MKELMHTTPEGLHSTRTDGSLVQVARTIALRLGEQAEWHAEQERLLAKLAEVTKERDALLAVGRCPSTAGGEQCADAAGHPTGHRIEAYVARERDEARAEARVNARLLAEVKRDRDEVWSRAQGYAADLRVIGANIAGIMVADDGVERTPCEQVVHGIRSLRDDLAESLLRAEVLDVKLERATAEHNNLLRQWSSVMEAAGIAPMLDDADGSRMTEGLIRRLGKTATPDPQRPIGSEGTWKPRQPDGYDPGARREPEKAADPHAWAKPGVWAVRTIGPEYPRKLVSQLADGWWDAYPGKSKVDPSQRRPATPEETARFEAELSKNMESAELVASIRHAVDHGTACLLCGKPKQPGTDYCPTHKAEEAADVAKNTGPIPLAVGQRWVWDEERPSLDSTIIKIDGELVHAHDDERPWNVDTFRAHHPRLRNPSELETTPEPKTSLPVVPATCGECEHWSKGATYYGCHRCGDISVVVTAKEPTHRDKPPPTWCPLRTPPTAVHR